LDLQLNEDLQQAIWYNNSGECISVYRGLQRIITIKPYRNDKIKIESSPKVMLLCDELFGVKNKNFLFENKLNELLIQIKKDKEFDRYYNNPKERFILYKKYLQL